MSPLEILEYSTGDGESPYRTWLLQLKDIQARARIRSRLDRLALGNFGDVKAVGNGVFEIRLFFGPGYRIYFAMINRTTVLLLCGGSKDSQKKDIERVQDYWAEFRSS